MEFFCLSSDTKPENVEMIAGKPLEIPNGSLLLEMDTKSIYAWDLENKTWRKQTT